MSTRETHFKVILLGDSGVGKTSIVNREMKGEFSLDQISTVGFSMVTHEFGIDNRRIYFNIWDTAGQETYRSLIPSYLRSTDAAIIVYSIINNDSFQNLFEWVQLAIENEAKIIIIFGNQNDLVDMRIIETHMGETFAEKNKLLFFEGSALTGDGIHDMFTYIFDELANMTPAQEPVSGSSYIEPIDSHKKSCC